MVLLNDIPQVNAQEDDDQAPPSIALHPSPSSPPPSFRSRSASPTSRRLLHDDPLHRHSTDQALADAFDDSESEAGDEPDDRQRLMRAQPGAPPPADTNTSTSAEPAGTASSSSANAESQAGSRGAQRTSTLLPFFGGTSSSNSNRHINSSNDGVFANLAAKPERGEKTEDLPPVRFAFYPLSKLRSVI